VTHPAAPVDVWGDVDARQLMTVARNDSTRYLGILTDAVIGLLVLPFNVHTLGPSAYGLVKAFELARARRRVAAAA